MLGFYDLKYISKVVNFNRYLGILSKMKRTTPEEAPSRKIRKLEATRTNDISKYNQVVFEEIAPCAWNSRQLIPFRVSLGLTVS